MSRSAFPQLTRSAIPCRSFTRKPPPSAIAHRSSGHHKLRATASLPSKEPTSNHRHRSFSTIHSVSQTVLLRSLTRTTPETRNRNAKPRSPRRLRRSASLPDNQGNFSQLKRNRGRNLPKLAFDKESRLRGLERRKVLRFSRGVQVGSSYTQARSCCGKDRGLRRRRTDEVGKRGRGTGWGETQSVKDNWSKTEKRGKSH